MFVMMFTGAHYDSRKEECGLCDGVCSSLTGCHKCLDAEEEERREQEMAEDNAIDDNDCVLCDGRGETVEYKMEEMGSGRREIMVVLCADCAAHKATRRSVWVGAYSANPTEECDEEFMCPDETWDGVLEKSEVKAFVEKALAEAKAKAKGYLWAHVVVVSWQGRVDEFYRNL